MPDVLNSDERALATLMPEQRLMVAIIRRAVDDLPVSRKFFETDNRMFCLCCEALRMDPDEVKTQIAKKLKTDSARAWKFSSASAI